MANTYKALSTTSVGAGGAANITFSNIPQIYTDLIIKVSGRGSTAANLLDMQVRVGNGTVDSSSNYNYLELTGIPSASIVAGGGGSNDKLNTIVNGANSTSDTFSNVEIYIPNYMVGSNKTISVDAATQNMSNGTQLRLQAWRWSSSSAINIVTLTPASGNFVQFTTATIYGINKE